ncbi:trypsin-like peptidase domain-containing protein [bacterium]|nr:trypsin-like peptidase domain-containing protein [bacterium]
MFDNKSRGTFLKFMNFIVLFILIFFVFDYVIHLGEKKKTVDYQIPEVKTRTVTVTNDEKNSIDIYKNSVPGVVNITSTALAMDYYYNVVPHSGSGSGFIIDAVKGIVLTNYHVVRDAKYLEVTLKNGKKSEALLLGADAAYDIAVLQLIKIPEKLNALELGDSSNLLIGQKVLAIGNPFGLDGTLTTGVISSLNRSLKSVGNIIMEGIIQTDAAINPGNSGGPLLDSSGRVIGINTAIFSPSGGSVGIGFTIPINRIKTIVPDLVSFGKVRRAFLGVHVQTLTPEFAKYLGLPIEKGAIIFEVIESTPASKAGLIGAQRFVRVGNMQVGLGGDIVVEASGKKIESQSDLITMISSKKPGDKLVLKVLRGTGFKEITVELGHN